MKTKNNELTCKRCGNAVEYKKELSSGICFACLKKPVDQFGEVTADDWEICLWRLQLKKWLKKLQVGRTKEKYAGIKISVPPLFMRRLKAPL